MTDREKLRRVLAELGKLATDATEGAANRNWALTVYALDAIRHEARDALDLVWEIRRGSV